MPIGLPPIRIEQRNEEREEKQDVNPMLISMLFMLVNKLAGPRDEQGRQEVNTGWEPYVSGVGS